MGKCLGRHQGQNFTLRAFTPRQYEDFKGSPDLTSIKPSTRLAFCSARVGTHVTTVTAGSDVVQSGRPIFDDFFQHLWLYIGNNTAKVAFQMVQRLWLIRIDQ
ncbi:hypothetical protein TNCV_3047811 [Trichonephila clavipes]|nr:hypothetical protein TNCV_3047811 [Trichonephila clavipes]